MGITNHLFNLETVTAGYSDMNEREDFNEEFSLSAFYYKATSAVKANHFI